MQEYKAKKKLTISLLVSGRTQTTEKCLNSLHKLLTELDSELILIDTGCDAELRQKLFHYTDQIIPFTWCDDFAAARNEGLKRAQGEWFLFLDDDEWFEDTTPLVDFFQSAESKAYHQALYVVRNYLDAQGKEYTDDWVSRIIRVENNTHFVGRVHEYLTPAIGKCKKLDAFVHHYGYIYSNEKEKQEHYERNSTLLKKMIQDEPGYMRWRVQLVQEYGFWGKAKELKQTAEEALAYCSSENQFYINQCRGTFYSAVIVAAMLEEKYEEACAKAVRFLSDSRNSWECKCNLCSYAAESAVKCKNSKLAIRFCAKYFEYYNKSMQEHSRSEEEQIIVENVIYVNKAVEKAMYQKMLFLWAENYVSLKSQADLENKEEQWEEDLSSKNNLSKDSSWDEFPAEKKQELSVCFDKIIANNGDFLNLPDNIWKIATGGLVDLGEKLLNLTLSQWKAAVSVLTSRNDPAKMETIYQNLQKIKTREDIRFDYFNMQYAAIFISLQGIEETYEKINQRFRFFEGATLKFYHHIYLDTAFQGEMEMLPPKCRAAVWLEKLFQCREDDWEQKLSYLRKCAKEDVSLGDVIKSFASLIGEEQERRIQAAEAASKELQLLAVQVKQKVAAMLANGMYAEALQIVKQLRGMLPADKELEELELQIQTMG